MKFNARSTAQKGGKKAARWTFGHWLRTKIQSTYAMAEKRLRQMVETCNFETLSRMQENIAETTERKKIEEIFALEMERQREQAHTREHKRKIELETEKAREAARQAYRAKQEEEYENICQHIKNNAEAQRTPLPTHRTPCLNSIEFLTKDTIRTLSIEEAQVIIPSVKQQINGILDLHNVADLLPLEEPMRIHSSRSLCLLSFGQTSGKRLEKKFIL